jgi:amidase
VQIAEANELRARVRAHVDALLGGNAVLLVPSAPGPAPKLGRPQEELNVFRMRLISLTSIAGLCGLPQVRSCTHVL